MSAGFGCSSSLRSLLKARFNQDGAVLKDLLEPDVYARWLDLRKQYFKDDDEIERVRPMFIAFMLYSKATKEAGLTEEGGVQQLLGKVSKKYHVPIKQHEVKVEVGKPRDALNAFNATPRRPTSRVLWLPSIDFTPTLKP